MIVRITQNLGRQFNIRLSDATLPAAENPFLDWSMFDFKFEQQTFLLLANTPSLFCTVIPTTAIDLRLAWRDLLRVNLENLFEMSGRISDFQRFVLPELEKITFSKSLNRSILSSLNEFATQVKVMHEMEFDDSKFISRRLNETLMSAIANPGESYAIPHDVFASLSFSDE